MRPATYQQSAYRALPSPRSRMISLALAFALVLALIWALIRMGALPGMNGRGEPTSLVVFSTSAEKATASKREVAKPQRRQRQPRRERAAAPPTPRTPPPPAVPPMTMADVPGFIRLSRRDYAAADVGAIASSPDDASASSAGADAGPAFEAGAAPGGLPLYYAEWYREPTHAETGPFMPANVERGWGIIACRTAPRFRVEDCRELGESPGSGVARGLRRASWQFLVRPPRKGNEPMIGVWVRIRFDIIPRAAE